MAPNLIDFDKVSIELQRISETGNVAVIITVSCVFGLYLMLILWVRKADQEDVLKVGISVSQGVDDDLILHLLNVFKSKSSNYQTTFALLFIADRR